MQIALNEFKSKLSLFINKMLADNDPIFITKHKKVIAKVVPSSNEELWKSVEKKMNGSVLKYKNPEEPVGLDNWEQLP